MKGESWQEIDRERLSGERRDWRHFVHFPVKLKKSKVVPVLN
jgi:hypothetical protein